MTRIPSVMTESRSGFFFRPQALWQMVRLLGHLRNLVVHSNLVVVQVAHTWKEAFGEASILGHQAVSILRSLTESILTQRGSML